MNTYKWKLHYNCTTIWKNKSTLRIRFSLKNLSYQDGLLNIPHFMSDYTKEIIKFI
jgi:hypothetical protein